MHAFCYQTLTYITHGKIFKKSYENNKFKISSPTWDEEFKLAKGSYSVSDIQNYFECIIKKHETLTYNLLIQIYVNRIENRITFKIKIEYSLELSMTETINLLGSSKKRITKDKNAENVLGLEVAEAVLVHYSLFNNTYQHDFCIHSHPINYLGA